MGHVASTSSKLLEAAKKIRIYMLWVLKVSNGSKRNLKHLALASSFLGVSFPCKLITSLVSIVGTYCYSQVNGNGDKMTGAKKHCPVIWRTSQCLEKCAKFTLEVLFAMNR